MRFTIIFYHSALLDQPGVVEEASESVGWQLRLDPPVAGQCCLKEWDHQVPGRNNHQGTSCEDCICCRVVVVDGVVAADQDDDKTRENTVVWRMVGLVGVVVEERLVNPRRFEGLSVVDEKDGSVENLVVVDSQQGC